MADDAFSHELGWASLTDSEREREYSPSSCVGGDLTPFLAEYAEASETARRWCGTAGATIQTLAYGPLASQTVDIAVPGADRPCPVVVFIHGGYWQELSKLDSFFPAPDLVARGVAYAAVDYTLAPAATVDQIVTECRSALDMLRSESPGLNIDPERIVIAGSSAGAHLAAMIGLGPSTPRPAGLVLLSGIYELEPLIGTTINDALHLDVAAAHRNSPARRPIEDPPPALLAVGENETDQFKLQTLLFHRALEAGGARTTKIEVGGRNHFDIVIDLGRVGTSLGDAVDRLIESTGEDHAQL